MPLVLTIVGVIAGLITAGTLIYFGAVDIIAALQADTLVAGEIAWGVVQIAFAGAAGSLVAAVFYLPAWIMINRTGRL